MRSHAKNALRTGVVLLASALAAQGCLTRPITNHEPDTHDIFTSALKQHGIDKVDLLFMIDNSSSMGDKQDLLAEAIPDLARRLLEPTCLDDATRAPVARVSGECPSGSKPAFEPVHDLHVGVITSALGGGGSPDVCQANAKLLEIPSLAKLDRHNDDRGHLIARKRPDPLNPPSGSAEDPVADASPNGFLAWLPPTPENAGKTTPGVPALSDRNKLVGDFADLVKGAQEHGCGLEAQMESWYRFLVQPDPWQSIGRSGDVATLDGVDAELLKQRHDFLRPDSLLAIVVVTDEEDSWSDPMWQGGRGWMTRTNTDVGSFATGGRLARATSACASPVDPSDPLHTGPNDPKCTSCGFSGVQDPECAKGPYTSQEDGLNVRYTNDMKRRYGVDPQLPVQRYVDALRSALVPDRRGEHFTTDGADAQQTASYLGRKNCTNPIYAASLPVDASGDLCHLARGARKSDMVFLAVIGGVPWQLLTADPKDNNAPFKTKLDGADWGRILGKDPSTYQLAGIDPHMIESVEPRAGIACGSGAGASCDPIHGREWDTHTSPVKIDLQYACTFDLPKAKDCTKDSTCDCPSGSPLCAANPNDGGKLTLQTRGKAYPTVRELRVAKALGEQAVVASICPRTLDTKSDDYGYRPAMRAIVERLESQLASQCLPQPLAVDANGDVSCQVLVVAPGGCDPQKGLSVPSEAVRGPFDAQRLQDLQREVDASGNPHVVTPAELDPVCVLHPLHAKDFPNQTCEGSKQAGWCYVTGAAAGTCALGQSQAIKFGQPPPGQTYIQCIQ